ncbi:hypothetical protein LDENG_00114370 [Lucifuga dentata]|nr:hypothetical protein LDENG_00114370 [Lucifuga dentata]
MCVLYLLGLNMQNQQCWRSLEYLSSLYLQKHSQANNIMILKDHTTHFACLILIYSVFIHVSYCQSFPKVYYWNARPIIS